MNKVDYIIIGFGLAGMSFARQLEKQKKTFKIFENNSQQSSKVAGGMYNPVILKRFTPVWDAELQLQLAIPFYEELETLFNSVYIKELNMNRLFSSVEEQNNWFAKCDHPILSKYLVPKVVTKKFNGIESEFGYGEVQGTGRIDAKALLADYQWYLESKGLLESNSFEYDKVQLKDNNVTYKNIQANRIVFCEGYGIKQNPFFNYLPLNEAKGELITIHAPDLEIDFILKSAVFIMPLGNDLYKVGATFNWKDKTNKPSKEGKQELVDKLNKILHCSFNVVDHVAGIRPTVKDRRPLVGVHSKYPQLAILNGLGTRGVMIAPRVSIELFDYLELEKPLRKEIDIKRFDV